MMRHMDHARLPSLSCLSELWTTVRETVYAGATRIRTPVPVRKAIGADGPALRCMVE